MNTFLKKLASLWRRIFFWQTPPGTSHEFRPHTHADHEVVLAVTAPKKVPGWKQLRFIGRVLKPGEQRLLIGALIVFVAGMVLGTAEVFRTRLEPVPAAGGTLTEALVGSPKLINPLYAPLNDVDRDLSALVFSGLFRLNDKLEAVPDLAERFRWSEDGLMFEVTLREGVRFHDGEPLTASDVEFTYQTAKNPAWRSPLGTALRGVTIVRVDERTVQFKLEQPRPTLPLDLTVGILPAHIWSQVSDTGAQLADANIRPIGSGPYRVESFTRDSRGSIINERLTRWSGYYGLQPYLDDWIFRFYPDRATAVDALKNHQVDTLAFVPWGEAESLRGDTLRTASIELPQVTVAFFNTKDELLKDESLRRALAMAVDPNELKELIGEHVTVASSPYPFLEATTGTAPDLEGSRALLEKIGWKLSEDGAERVKDATATASGTTLAIRVDVPDQPDLRKIAELLQRRWSLVGAKVELRVQDAETLLRDAALTRNHQVLVWNILLGPELDLTPFWSSTQTGERGLNFSNLADRDIDAALALARTATSTEALAEAREKVSTAILRRVPALFLLQPSYAYLVPKRVGGVASQRVSRPSDRFYQTFSWYLKTGWSWK